MMAGNLTITAKIAFHACGEGCCGYCGEWTPRLFEICMEICGEEHVIERNDYPFEICLACQPKVRLNVSKVETRHQC